MQTKTPSPTAPGSLGKSENASPEGSSRSPKEVAVSPEELRRRLCDAVLLRKWMLEEDIDQSWDDTSDQTDGCSNSESDALSR